LRERPSGKDRVQAVPHPGLAAARRDGDARRPGPADVPGPDAPGEGAAAGESAGLARRSL